MTCHDVQQRLSLYLYGELDFAAEEAVETHLESCAYCQLTLGREKAWHSSASAEQLDVPLDLLAASRQNLRTAIAEERNAPPARSRWQWSWPAAWRITPHRWSLQLAAASFLVFIGYAGAHLVSGVGGFGNFGGPLVSAGLLNPSASRIRDIQAAGPGRVRILVDQVSQRELVGSPNDENMRRWLLIAAQDSSDPGIRVDSVNVLSQESGTDIRDALLDRIQHDSNTAVRLKALESVRRFAADPQTRTVLRSVLENDGNASIRSEAIDVLAPVNEKPQLSPELLLTLETLARSEHDEYVRGRCLQLLHATSDPAEIY